MESWYLLLLGVAMTLGMLVVIFPPISIWPLAYICFVPWLVVIGATSSARRMYLMSYVLGALFFTVSMHWMFLVTFAGAAVLFLALAFYFPLVACPVRHMVRRRGMPLAVMFPVIWVGCEAVRSMLLPKFPWGLLGHTHHNMLPMIQISDLVGAYGVSFVVAAVNGLVADLLLSKWGWPRRCPSETPPRLTRQSLVFTATVVVCCLAYGVFRLRQDTITEGPSIAILQGNYPNYVDAETSDREPTPRQRAARYFELLAQAGASNPDMFLLPETPWSMYLNEEFLSKPLSRWWPSWYAMRPQACYDALRDAAIRYKAYVVTGSASSEPRPYDILAEELRYNSAFVFPPDGSRPERYDKIHLVLIGEYVPFRYGPLRFMYLWLNRHLPFGGENYEYSLSPGSEFRTFAMNSRSQGGRSYTFGTPICYENVMPYVSRRFVTGAGGEKRCDFLLNLSNDGWFPHSWELPQHLAASVFRAVENRVGVARAVNTGISCFVDPDGRVHHMVEKNGVAVGPGVDGFRVSRVRVDSRHSFYSRHGDLFAILCATCWGLFYLDYILVRSLAARASKEAASL